jgi:Uma2 family endonuclease
VTATVGASALVKTTAEYDPPLTVDAFERMPGGEGKEELHDGRIVRVAPAGGVHGQLVLELAGFLKARIRQLGGNAWGRVTTETGFVLWPDRRRESRAPDVAVVRAHRLPGGRLPRRLIRGIPDLAVEVLSPNDPPDAVQAKVEEYLAAGVPRVWVVDPLVEVVVWTPAAPAGTVLRAAAAGPAAPFPDVLDGGDVLPGFRLPLGELWETLGDVAGEDDA